MAVFTYVYMPNAFVNVIRARPISKLGSVAPEDVVPLLVFEIPDSTREEASTDKIKQASGGYQEILQFCGRSSPSKV